MYVVIVFLIPQEIQSIQLSKIALVIGPLVKKKGKKNAHLTNRNHSNSNSPSLIVSPKIVPALEF